MIIDKHNRIHNYLRISIIDNCNFRCTYCMPDEKMDFLPSNKLMSADEIYTIAETFVKLGVNKIRLTGGEPLIRKDFAHIIHRLSLLPIELTLTTNGLLINTHLNDFIKAGITSVNVSLDSLKPDKFFALSKRNKFTQVYNNIMLLLEHNIHVKVNVVAIKGINDDEINSFIALTKNYPLHIRFIEFMPFEGNKWDKKNVFGSDEILEIAAQEFSFIKMKDEKNATAKKYKPLNHLGTFAIISTMSQPFCSTCNRLRLTADGKMKNCLFSNGEADILTPFRNGVNIEQVIKQCVFEKHKERGGQISQTYTNTDAKTINNRSMVSIGG